jgi:phosphoglucomutase
VLNVNELYKIWSSDPYFDKDIRDELHQIKDQTNEINERFYKYLEFGTGGLRGIIGAGTNRVNIYTVGLATEGFARYINSMDHPSEKRCVVISYDSRTQSEEFARTTALVFASHGIKAFLSDELRPTPMLSYAVRHYRASGGVMITASHNPAEYNGYKAYGSDGGQVPPEASSDITSCMESVEDIRQITWMQWEEAMECGLIEYFGIELDDAYMKMLKELIINPKVVSDHRDLKIVYTPLHGTGNKPVRRILKEVGFDHVFVVPEQADPDPHFSTVKSPNPEERKALELAIQMAKSLEADLVIATDPDGDRIGLAVRDLGGDYLVLTGNQIGVLLMDYILGSKKKAGTLQDSSFVVTTIVSTKLTRKIAQYYGIRLFEVLTGFKFIGEIIKEYDEQGSMKFEFGFEESYGFLAGTQVRDKDAVVTAMLIAEMAAYARSRSMTLYDLLLELYKIYGYAKEKTVSISLEGKEGAEKIRYAISKMRENNPKMREDLSVSSVSDYLLSRKTNYENNRFTVLDLGKSDVLLFALEGLDWFCIRPSGTEPKIKIYFGVYGPDEDCCEKRLEYLSNYVMKMINSYL